MNSKVEDLILKYTIGFPCRYTRKQKNRFLNEVGKEFQAMGYEVRATAAKVKRSAAMNLHVGNVSKAKKIIVVNYDTPAYTFGIRTKYYPLDGPATFASNLMPAYLPMIMVGLLSLWIAYSQLTKINFADNFIFSAGVIVLFMGLLGLSYFIAKGIGNKVNFNRNTSSIIVALQLASQLDSSKREEIAFVLTDNGCTNHAGDYMLRQALPTTIDQRQVILLDCVGNGEEIVIGYKEKSKELADKVAKSFNEDVRKKLCSTESLVYTSFSFYENAILITCAQDDNGSFVVENIGSKKDIICDGKRIEQIVESLMKI